MNKVININKYLFSNFLNCEGVANFKFKRNKKEENKIDKNTFYKEFHRIFNKEKKSIKKYFKTKNDFDNLQLGFYSNIKINYIKSPVKFKENIDLIEKNKNNTFNIFILKPHTTKKEIDLYHLFLLKTILEMMGLRISNCYLVHLNSKYIRKNKITKDIFYKINLTREILQKESALKEKLIELINNKVLNKKQDLEREPKKCNACPLKQKCWSLLKEDSILNLINISNKKVNYFKSKGIYTISQIRDEDVNILNENHRRQCYSFMSHTTYLNIEELNSNIQKLNKNNSVFCKIYHENRIIPLKKGKKVNQTILTKALVIKNNTIHEYDLNNPLDIIKFINKVKDYNIITFNDRLLNIFLFKNKEFDFLNLRTQIIDLEKFFKNMIVYDYQLKSDLSLNNIYNKLIDDQQTDPIYQIQKTFDFLKNLELPKLKSS